MNKLTQDEVGSVLEAAAVMAENEIKQPQAENQADADEMDVPSKEGYPWLDCSWWIMLCIELLLLF